MVRWLCVILSTILCSPNCSIIHSSESFLLPFPLTLTATPGEFRGPHLHAGIDLSTKQTTGWPVYAIDDGTVVRIKSKIRSEGKALYIRHLNGKISVYAHLEDFASSLLKIIPNQRYFDIFPKTNLKVQRGQIIGYSGESGAGLPHLHFEIRKNLSISSKDSILLNQFKEKYSPLIEKFHFVKPETGEVSLSVSAQSMNRSTHRPLIFMEPVAIAVQMYDRVKNNNARCNVPYFRLKHNSKVLYEAHLDEVKFPRDYHSSMHFLTQFTGFQPTLFSYKLYKDFPQSSPFIKKHQNDGWLKAGTYELEIEAWDYFDNKTTQKISVKVLKQNLPKPKPEWMELSSSRKFILQSGPAKLVFNSNSSSKLDEVELQWKNDPHPQIRIGPAGLFFTRSAKLILPTPAESYWANLVGPMSYQKNSDTIEIKLSGAEYLRLLPDKKKPWISQSLRKLAGLRKTRYYVRAGDKQSGLDQNSVMATCGNQKRFIEWDTDRRWLWIEKPCDDMRVKVCDKVGLCNSKIVNSVPGKSKR